MVIVSLLGAMTSPDLGLSPWLTVLELSSQSMERTLNSNRKLLVESKTVHVIAADGVTSRLAFDSVLYRGHSQAGVLEILHPHPTM